MSWEQDITRQLQEVQDIAVRFDIQQELTPTQKTTARNNIDIKSTATNISGSDFNIVLNY